MRKQQIEFLKELRERIEKDCEGYVAPISNSLDSASMDLGNEAVSLSLGSSIERRFPPDERLGEAAIQDQLDLEEYFR